jgi:putative FmdB family regulatory protein
VPIFEFRCGRCGREFEKLVSTASAGVSCPACSSRKVEKKFSVFGSKSGGKFTSSQGGSGCSSCAKSSCSSCH